MNFGEIRQHVAADLTIRTTDAARMREVDAGINAAYYGMTASIETPFRLKDTEIAITDTTTAIDLPVDNRRVNAVVLASTGRHLDWTRRDVDAANYGHPAGAVRSRGTPCAWEELGGHLYVFPYPDAADTLIVEYLSIVQPLILSADMPIVAAECHYGISYGAIEQLSAHPPYDPRITAMAREWRLKTELDIAFIHRGRSQRLAQIQSLLHQRGPYAGPVVTRWNAT